MPESPAVHEEDLSYHKTISIEDYDTNLYKSIESDLN